jgi:arginine utilization regulatory protein
VKIIFGIVILFMHYAKKFQSAIMNITNKCNAMIILTSGYRYKVVVGGDRMATSQEKLFFLLNLHVLRNIFDTLDEGILVVDRDCRVVFYNKTLSNFEGLESQNVVGKPLFDLFPSITPEESTLYQVMKTGIPITNWYQQYINCKGKQFNTVNTTIPIVEDEEVIGALEVSRDISVVVNLTERITNLQQKGASKLKPISHNGFRYSFKDIIGSGQKIRQVIEILKRVSQTTSTVLIYGETGTGKELFAQSIHNESPRKHRPFIAQNCAALPETLLEGIFFGTTKGSFTGAMDKAGLFEQANGGTLLLDEINSMGHFLQAKILRVLQEGVVRRLGGSEDILIDVRVIATTNEKPSELLETGKLRADLFYRLSVIYVEIPALRERMEDLEELVQYFIEKYNYKFNKNVNEVDLVLLQILREYKWPGNVRELEHVIEAMMNFVDEGKITSQQLFCCGYGAFKNFVENNHCVKMDFRDDIHFLEKNMIIKILEKHGGNISHAAKEMGLKRQSLQYRLKKYNIGQSCMRRAD